jgi:hypothetical protein
MASKLAPKMDLSGLSQSGSAQQQPDATQDSSQDQSQQGQSQDQSQQSAPASDSTQGTTSSSDPGSADADATSPSDAAVSDESASANAPAGIHRAFSALNEKIIKMLDENGCKRAFTVPYADAPMAKHIADVGTVAASAGGLGNNILVTAHHSTGAGFGSSDGHTVGYNADALRSTILPSGDTSAKAAIDACKSLITKVSKLIGEYIPEVKTAKSQLELVGRAGGRGMNLCDLAVVLLQIPGPALQALARAYSETHDGGASSQLRGPHERKTPKQ